MRIAIDIFPLQTQSRYRGIGAHIKGILRGLFELNTKHEFILICSKNNIPLELLREKPENFAVEYVNFSFGGYFDIMYNWLIKRKFAEKIISEIDPDVYFDSSFAEMWCPPLNPESRIVTWIYDLIFFKFPEYHAKNLKQKIKHLLWHKKLMNALKNYIITSSNFVKHELLADYDLDDKKIFVVPLGVDQKFFEVNLDKAIENHIKQKYILYVGGIDPRKNLIRAIKAYSLALKEADLPKLLILGKINKDDENFLRLMREIKNNKLSDKIVFHGFVPDDQLPAMYANAQFLLFPSLYEGFGLPVVEAMAAGCPVLTSNRSAMPEVAGDCALMVDPYDVEEIASAILKLAGDEQLRTKLAECGRKRARQFSWAKTAEKFVDTLEKVVKNG